MINKKQAIIKKWFQEDGNLINLDGEISINGRKVGDVFTRLPEQVLQSFSDSGYKVAVGSREAINRKIAPYDHLSKGVSGQNIRSENAHAFGGHAAMVCLSEDGANKAGMGDTVIHEAGHAIDHVNAGMNGYMSLKSQSFKKATDDYWERQSGKENTQIIFRGERSFRGDHIVHYNSSSTSTSRYKELSAELFNKFVQRSEELGIKEADRSLKGDYGSAWDAYKQDVCPQIGEDIKNELDINVERTKNHSKSAFGRAADWAGRVKDRVFGKTESIRDANWQPEKVSGQNAAMLETSGMSHKQLSSFKDELGNNGINFNTASNADGSRSSIAVSDPNSLDRLQNYVQTGSPETTLAQSRVDNTVMFGM